MDDTSTANVIAGALLPLVIGLLARVGWGAQIKSVFALMVSIVAVVVSLALQGELTSGGDIVQTFAEIWATAMITYQAIWKPTGVAAIAERIPLTGTGGQITGAVFVGGLVLGVVGGLAAASGPTLL